VIRLSHINKIYRTAEVETTALRDLNFQMHSGEFVAFMGPSGCGKSTFLNILGTLDRPSSGEYWLGERDVTLLSEAQLLDLRKTTIGFIFQNFNLINDINVFDNVALALRYHRNISTQERKHRVTEALERMKVSHRARHLPQQLSGGQQQRVAIARAVVTRPKLLLADEPTGNLDSETGEDVMRLLSELNQTGTAIVIVTHSDAHAECADRIIRMLDGVILSENTKEFA